MYLEFDYGFPRVRIYWKVDIYAKNCQNDAEGVYRN